MLDDIYVGGRVLTLRFPRLGQKWAVLANCIGLSCVGSALFLQCIVLGGILQNGYFRGIEQNPIVLWFEIVLTVFGVTYFGYLFVRFIWLHR